MGTLDLKVISVSTDVVLTHTGGFSLFRTTVLSCKTLSYSYGFLHVTGHLMSKAILVGLGYATV